SFLSELEVVELPTVINASLKASSNPGLEQWTLCSVHCHSQSQGGAIRESLRFACAARCYFHRNRDLAVKFIAVPSLCFSVFVAMTFGVDAIRLGHRVLALEERCGGEQPNRAVLHLYSSYTGGF